MSKSETIMAGAKRLLVTSLAAMFAGLTTSAKANGFKAKPRDDNGCYGRPKKFYKNLVPDRPKFDFVSRASSAGFGVFRNRTTGEYLTLKIANPKSTKATPRREMPYHEAKYFGLN